MVNSPKTRKRRPKYGLVEVGSDEEQKSDKCQPQLSELFVDDAWGTAKSLPSLKQHPDHKKWLQRNGISVKAFKDLEKRLSIYEELRDLDPNAFRAIIDPIKSTESAVCTPLDLAKEYLFNTTFTALLGLFSIITEAQAARYAGCAIILANLAFWAQGTSLYGRCHSFYWQTIQQGHKASWLTCLAYNFAEVLYLISTLGLGFFVSLGLRLAASKQSFSERALGIQLVKEHQILTEEPRF